MICEEILIVSKLLTRERGKDFAIKNAVPTHDIAVLVPKSFATPGNVVETETCSNELKNIANINDSVMTANFLGGNRED
jgi:hypothetical protein